MEFGSVKVNCTCILKSEFFMEDNLAVIHFENAQEWSEWLENHIDEKEVWVRIAKKGSGLTSVSYQQAVDAGLCYGWIDGQKRKYDEVSYIQRFTPRRPNSNWSKINRDKALQFIKEGKMKPAGFAAIENAKKSGAWNNVYDPQSTIEIPDDFQKLLSKNEKAKVFFDTLNKTNRYAILYRIKTAKKPKTREKRIRQFIEMLNKKEKIYT